MSDDVHIRLASFADLTMSLIHFELRQYTRNFVRTINCTSFESPSTFNCNRIQTANGLKWPVFVIQDSQLWANLLICIDWSMVYDMRGTNTVETFVHAAEREKEDAKGVLSATHLLTCTLQME